MRRCDAVAVSVYSVEDRLLTALFKPWPRKAPNAAALSTAAVQGLDDPAQPRAPPAPSEGTGLTPEELELIRSAAGDDPDTGTESAEDFDAEDDFHPDPKANFIQANGSSYRAMIVPDMIEGVGFGVSCAFGSARECKGRHAVLLLSAGHFAACIFGKNGRVEQHRTCKRYVVRGKQGGAQGGHDKKGGKAKSIGAQMRREGEKKLAEDVRKVMLEWADLLQKCDAVFVSCPPDRRSTLFGITLEASDPRVRRIPFAGVGRPNMTACITAHSLICSALFFRSWPPGVVLERLPSFSECAAQRPSSGCPDDELKAECATKVGAADVEADYEPPDSEGEPGSGHDRPQAADEASGTPLDSEEEEDEKRGQVLEAQRQRPRQSARRPRPVRAPRGAKEQGASRRCDDSEILEAALLEAKGADHRWRAEVFALVFALGVLGAAICHRSRIDAALAGALTWG